MLAATLHTTSGISKVTSDTWRREILERGYQAFIFDCDGTLVESADVHLASVSGAAAEQGYTVDPDWYFARTGLDRASLIQEFAKDCAKDFDIEMASNRSITLFIELSDRVVAVPEVKKLVSFLHGTYPLAVGTNAERQVAEASLRATNLLRYFDQLVAVTDGLMPKPSPKIFDRAARLLGKPLSQTLVIEDSVQGVMAAKAAGMDVIKIE